MTIGGYIWLRDGRLFPQFISQKYLKSLPASPSLPVTIKKCPVGSPFLTLGGRMEHAEMKVYYVVFSSWFLEFIPKYESYKLGNSRVWRNTCKPM